MKVHRLYREQIVRKPLEEVFAFFERPENLDAITPPELGFHILTPSPIPMQHGTLIDYTIRLLGIPMRWTTYIAQYDPPHRFVDVQLRGPYSFWHHTHTFTPIDHTTTKIIDEVLYAIPFGIVGELAHVLWIRRTLDRIFRYRAKRIAELLGTHPSHK